MGRLLGFPNPVNEKAARVVAGVVAATCALILATGWQWLLVLVAYGFWARVLTGPRLSPLGRFATVVAGPRLGAPRYVPGPPKRFAQAIGAAVTTAAAVFALALGWTTAAEVLTAMMVVFAALESALALCVGCKIFGALMAAGLVPDDVCAECANIRA
jgi:Domain of unknown function (DUF4395)